MPNFDWFYSTFFFLVFLSDFTADSPEGEIHHRLCETQISEPLEYLFAGMKVI